MPTASLSDAAQFGLGIGLSLVGSFVEMQGGPVSTGSEGWASAASPRCGSRINPIGNRGSCAVPIFPPEIYVEDTGTPRGHGVFAARAYRKDELVEVSVVVLLEGAASHWPLVMQRMVFAWPSDEPGRMAHAIALGYGSLYNGANPANLRFERERAAAQMRFIAARDIAAGEELTINYSAADGSSSSTGDDWFAEHEIELSP